MKQEIEGKCENSKEPQESFGVDDPTTCETNGVLSQEHIPVVRKAKGKRDYYFDTELTAFIIKEIEDKSKKYDSIEEF